METTPIIELSHVSVRYGERAVLEDVTLTVEPGRYVGVIGPNGSGKSTLLRALLGTTALAAGAVRIGGGTPEQGRGAFAYVPQHRTEVRDFPLTVGDVVMMARLRGMAPWRRIGRRDREIVAWALERVGMADRRESLIGELSGGQQQRVFIARALAQEGRVLLLDEPLTGVDAGTMDLVLTLLEELHREGRTILITTHDLNTTADTCDTLLLLNTRVIAYGPMADTFTPALLEATFGRHVHIGAGEGGPHAEVTENVIHH